jgi:hypothetical protein
MFIQTKGSWSLIAEQGCVGRDTRLGNRRDQLVSLWHTL